MNTQKTSRIPKFYKQPLQKRQSTIKAWANLEEHSLTTQTLSPQEADHMIENAIGTFALPLGIATNFLINNKDYLIPMTIEEPSVIAAVSNAAKLFREGGGFTTSSDQPIMIGQIQVLDIPDIKSAKEIILTNKQQLLKEANQASQDMIRYGGGAYDLNIRHLKTRIGPMLIIHILYNTQDAMGANTINTVVEHLSSHIEEITKGRTNLKILSNLADQRKAYATGTIPASQLATSQLTGTEVVKSIIEAAVFAEADPYRATTHNKGIMNGVDAVVIATGNDWRAIEAGAHAYAARNGTYTSLTKWSQDKDGNLHGSIELPMAVGIVGGATQVHPTAKTALRILQVKTARELSEIIAAVGLAQNLAAMRALATEGIQRGHMRLHARQMAIAAGASSDMVAQIVQTMIDEKDIRLERAEELVQTFQQGN